MPIVAADLKAFLSANMPLDDVTTSGGAIDLAGKVTDLVLASTSTLEVLSDAAGDTTQTVTVTARDAAGAIVSEGVTLTGTTPVVLSTMGAVERVLRVVIDATHTGTVTVRIQSAGATVCTLEPAGTAPATSGTALLTAHRNMYDSSSESGATIRYEKIFWRNDHATLTLSNAVVQLSADPSANVQIGLATAKDDTGSVANRESAPGGVSFVDDGVDQAVPTGDLAAGEAIGVWMEYSLAGDEAAVKSTWQTQIAGNTV